MAGRNGVDQCYQKHKINTMGFFSNLFGVPDAVRQRLAEGAVIIDVRTPQEFSGGHIKGSKNVPLDTLPSRLSEIKRLNKPVITVCRSGVRSSSACSFLTSQGIEAVDGGAWTHVNKLAS